MQNEMTYSFFTVRNESGILHVRAYREMLSIAFSFISGWILHWSSSRPIVILSYDSRTLSVLLLRAEKHH